VRAFEDRLAEAEAGAFEDRLAEVRASVDRLAVVVDKWAPALAICNCTCLFGSS
jgi:hypothetical protein